MNRLYLVRYGLMSHVGRFTSVEDTPRRRGEPVVVTTSRGTEIGEILTELPVSDLAAPPLRTAQIDDFETARRARADRSRRFDACEAIFRDGTWPMDLIDVEPLLDDGRTVLHYLGPHRLDTSGLREVIRDRCGLDVTLEPVGRDVPDDDEAAVEDDHGCGSCSSGGGCGTSGGCGTESGGCGSCAVKDLVKTSRAASERS